MAKTNSKMDEYYKKKSVQSYVIMPILHAEEEKKKGEPSYA